MLLWLAESKTAFSAYCISIRQSYVLLCYITRQTDIWATWLYAPACALLLPSLALGWLSLGAMG